MPKYQVYLPFEISANSVQEAALLFTQKISRIGLYNVQLYIEGPAGEYVASGDGQSFEPIDIAEPLLSETLPHVEQPDVTTDGVVSLADQVVAAEVLYGEVDINKKMADHVFQDLELGPEDAESLEAYNYAMSIDQGDNTNE
jgi:hypothetical protein